MAQRDTVTFAALLAPHLFKGGRTEGPEETTRSITTNHLQQAPAYEVRSFPPSTDVVGAFFCPFFNQTTVGPCAAVRTIAPMEWLVISLASALAGFIDAIVGGGGLILLPALFAVFPSAPPATLFGTNKSAAIWGTGVATWQYSRRVAIRWSALWPGALAALAGAFSGAWCVTLLDPNFLRKALPLVLLGLLLYTLAKKELGRAHAPRHSGLQEQWRTALIGALIGFYDGFFGPGTGSFFVFLLVRVLGYDFLNASVSAKLLNLATNLAALVLFTWKGHVWWHLAFPLAAANVLGSVLGSWLALRHGTGFVRVIFVVVVGTLIVKTGTDAFLS